MLPPEPAPFPLLVLLLTVSVPPFPPARSAIIEEPQGLAVMKRREGYKGYVIVARSLEVNEGEFSAQFTIEEHDPEAVLESEFYLPETFSTQESAIEAAIQAGRQKIDAGFERGKVVVNE